jgi:hypothetical protein
MAPISSWSVGGIDPGVNGGIVILSQDGRIAAKTVMPATMPEIAAFFDQHRPAYVLIEKAQYMRPAAMGDSHHSPQAFFRYGKHAGHLEAILSTLGIPYGLIAPTSWQREMGILAGVRGSGFGKSTKQGPKVRSLMAAKLFFPHETWLMQPRSRAPHSGVYEAALIAELARRRKIAGVLG